MEEEHKNEVEEAMKKKNIFEKHKLNKFKGY
jgi:hypothetical protein